MQSGLYTLSSPTLSLIEDNGRHTSLMVPQGATVTIAEETFSGDRLVEVQWAGRTVLMFADDLRTRLKRVDPKSRGPILVKSATHKAG